jgi:hypothetical protein
MTKNVYKTAQGKIVDLGALILQNEGVRAVGNMNVNARGDVLDSSDRVIDSKAKQIQRQNQRHTQVAKPPPQSKPQPATVKTPPEVSETVLDLPTQDQPADTSGNGLAAAMARSKQTGKK